MKKKTRIIAYQLIALLVAALLFASCKKDKGQDGKKGKTITLYSAVYGSKTTALASINGNANEAITRAGKIYVKDNYIFLNDLNKGIHVYDNSNPAQPRQIAFLAIPGNLDIAVNGNILYADMYTDLLAIDISNPSRVTVTSTIENFFHGRYYVNGVQTSINGQVVTKWLERDTVVDENYNNGCLWCGEDVFITMASGQKSTGTAGSMAGMVIMNDHLFAITEMHSVGILNLHNASNPVKLNDFFAGYDLQTIFPFQNKLFLGSAVGMFMFDVSNPASPVSLGEFTHGRACDPVITDGQYAYVTLHSGDGCGGEANELHVIDVRQLPQSSLVKTYQLNKPTGLSKDGQLLFVCDDTEVKLYNASNPANMPLLKKIASNKPYDVITTGNNKAIVVCEDGLYQYDYSNLNAIRRLSVLPTKR